MLALNIRFNGFIFVLICSLCWGLSPAYAEVATPKKLEIIDAMGRQVSLKAAPQRIVTIFSSNTELVTALGLGDRIVGIDSYTYYPPEITNRPKVGGRLGISLEQVLAQNPDLVIMTPARQAVHVLLAPLEKMGVPSVVLSCRTVEDIMENIHQVAILTGVPEAGSKVIDELQQRLNDVELKRQGRRKPRVVLITGRLASGLFMVARKGDYTADIVELAGGVLALDEGGKQSFRISQISPEALLGLDPDIIIYTRRRNEGIELENYLRTDSFSPLRARRDNNIYDVPSSEFLIPGPRVADGVERLADIFERWECK